jgi:serine phosphatase RsbU (regulator of sigma subunit)
MRKTILFLLFIVFIWNTSQAQFLDKKIYLVDSIEKKESNKNDFIIIEKNLKLYKQTKSDTVKLEILNEIIETCNDENIWYRYNRLMYQQATTLAVKEKSGQLKRKLTSYKALAINNVGFYIQNYTSNPSLSLKFYKQAALIQEEIGDNKGLIYSNNNIGNVLYNDGKILEAINIFQQVIRISEATENNYDLTPVLNNLGDIYMFLGDSAKGYIYVKRALASAMQNGDKRIIAQELQNIGILEKERGRLNYSIVCLKKALVIREEIGDINGICKSKSNLAALYLEKNDFAVAKRYLNDVKKLLPEVDNLAVNEVYHSIMHLYYSALNETNNAIVELEMALKFSQESGSIREELNNSSALIALYKIQHSDEKELKLYRRMSELNRKINAAEQKRNALKNSYEFEYAKKEQDQKTEQALKDEKSKSEKRKQKFITYGISLILLLTLIFSFFIFKAFKISKQKNVIISTQKQEVEKQKHFIEEKQKEIVDSINYAKRIQNTLLANDEIITKNLPQHFILFKPKDIVSGDFYWANSVVTENLDLFFIASCDSTGHGVPGAFMSLLNTNFINEAINEKHIYEPNKVFNYVRKRLINSISKENQKDGFDGILVCINKTNNTITYSAANNAPILITKQNELIKLPFDKMPVGKGEKEIEFNLYSINVNPGDWLYIYTDGFADQFGGPNGKKYKYKPLNEFLISINELSAHQQSQKLNQKFEDWKGDLEQVDDVCVVGLQL